MITRRGAFLGTTALMAAGVSTAAYGYGIEAPSMRVTTYRPCPPSWPKGYRLKIAVLADPHIVEPWMGITRLRRIIAATDALEPDIVLLLGDYLAGSRIRKLAESVPAPAAWATEFAKLKTKLGIFAVLGNHDWWDDPMAWRRQAGPTECHRAFAEVGIPLLENKAVRLKHGGQSFWIAGLGDQWAFLLPRSMRFGRGTIYRGTHDLPGTLAQITDEAPVILMAHEPDIFPEVPERIALTLSGHTHGGQISAFGYSPLVPSRYGTRYIYGHIIEQNRHLIVSAGLGCSLLPVRIGATPEIVVVELGT